MKTKRIQLLFLSAFLIMYVSAQTTHPVLIEGRITNTTEKQVTLFIADENGLGDIDTIPLQEDGSFRYLTYRITIPQKTSLRNKDIQLNDFFIAPGYHLTITGDGTDFLTLMKSAKIEGAESNRYKLLHDSIMVARMDRTQWYELKGDSLLEYIRNQKHLTDSLEKVVFHKNDTTDPYLSYFGRMTYLNNQFQNLYFLLAAVTMKQLEEEKACSFALETADKTILNNLFEEEYMISDMYKTWFLSQYRTYLINKDTENNPEMENTLLYRLEKVKTGFPGKAGEYVLFNLMGGNIDTNIRTLEQLNTYRSEVEPYIASLSNEKYRQSLISAFEEKERFLKLTRVGQPALGFSLKSSTGETYSLEHFQGKVVYIDLWASWCGPCRKEIPALRAFYEKYKDDDRIEIVGIAVHDGYNDWKKALEEDKPEWLQLHDANGVVTQAYEANAIPKYILIDKKGNIADMNAPSPGNRETLVDKLNAELNK
ncbi:TlpA disulfide reductase family protein [uncultured Proteiniphilum sp.]|uniref:TlpA disulfide reductase family protein n=1 Tax=uncultured Proteiniphilum sp. TaxID=497637 RepID=UPI0026316905|nr:TlpA disulfide reductase family protein [uncultured Proteiniphilum sp.]